MRQLVPFAVSLLLLSGDALASVPLAGPHSAPGVETHDHGTLVARRRHKKRKKKRRKRRTTKTRAVQPSVTSPSNDTVGEKNAQTGDAARSGDAAGAKSGSTGSATNSSGAAGPSAGVPSGSNAWEAPSWASQSKSPAGGAGGPEGSDDSEGSVAEVESSAQASPDERPGGVAGAIVIVRAGYIGAGRRFKIQDNTTRNLHPYRADFVSVAGGQIEAYPGALAGVPGLDLVGLRGSYWQAVGLQSTTKENPDDTFSTSWKELDAGLTVRLPLGDTLTTVAVSYGMLDFVVSLPSSVASTGDVPDLGYQYIRAGVDFRYAIGAASVLAGGGYRHLLGTGELGDDVFPGSSAIGYDASAGFAYQLLDHVEVQLAGKYTGFVHDLKSNHTYEASGATDTYWGGEAGLRLFF